MLSKFKVGSGVVGNPITFRGPDGKQYVAVYAGIGGDWLLLAGDVRSDDPADVRAAGGLPQGHRAAYQPGRHRLDLRAVTMSRAPSIPAVIVSPLAPWCSAPAAPASTRRHRGAGLRPAGRSATKLISRPAACYPRLRPLTQSRHEDAGEGAGAAGELFTAMNCDGCHGGGGVGWVGPSLADGRWRYGGADEEIFASIYYGRPKGMPAFGGRLGTEGVWTLVTYLKSLTPPGGRRNRVLGHNDFNPLGAPSCSRPGPDSRRQTD